MEDGQSALVVKVHHTLADGLGGVQLLSHLVDVDPASVRLGTMPPVPPPASPRSGSVSEAFDYAGRQMVGATRSVAAKLIRTGFSAVRDPVATTRDATVTARAIFDVLRRPPPSMSPVFGERRDRPAVHGDRRAYRRPEGSGPRLGLLLRRTGPGGCIPSVRRWVLR